MKPIKNNSIHLKNIYISNKMCFIISNYLTEFVIYSYCFNKLCITTHYNNNSFENNFLILRTLQSYRKSLKNSIYAYIFALKMCSVVIN